MNERVKLFNNAGAYVSKCIQRLIQGLTRTENDVIYAAPALDGSSAEDGVKRECRVSGKVHRWRWRSPLGMRRIWLLL